MTPETTLRARQRRVDRNHTSRTMTTNQQLYLGDTSEKGSEAVAAAVVSIARGRAVIQ